MTKKVIMNYTNLSDEEYSKILEPFENKTKKYLDNLVYNYVTYYLATAFKFNVLEINSDLQLHINAALDDIGYTNGKINLKVSNIEKILKQKYGLIIKNESPLKIIDTQKKDQP